MISPPVPMKTFCDELGTNRIKDRPRPQSGMVYYLNLANTSNEVKESQVKTSSDSMSKGRLKLKNKTLPMGTQYHQHTNIHSVHEIPSREMLHGHMKKVHNSMTAEDFLIDKMHWNPTNVTLSKHWLFEISNWRRDIMLFDKRAMHWPKPGHQPSVTLNREMPELSIQFGAGTAKKMIALLTKIYLRDKFQYHVWKEICDDMDIHDDSNGELSKAQERLKHAEETLNGLSDNSSQEDRNAFETAVVEAREKVSAIKSASQRARATPPKTNLALLRERMTEMRNSEFGNKYHSTFGGIDISKITDSEMDTIFNQQATDMINKLEWSMTHSQFLLSEFYKFIQEFKMGGEHPNFSRPITEAQSGHSYLKTVQAAVDQAYTRSRPSEDAGFSEDTDILKIKSDALEVACIEVFLKYYTDFHNQVLTVMAVFCNALHMQNHLPKMIELYKRSIFDLTNKQTVENDRLLQLFGQFTHIFNIAKLSEMDEKSYVNVVRSQIKKSLNGCVPGPSTYSSTEKRNADMIVMQVLNSDDKLQQKIKLSLQAALRPNMQYLEETFEKRIANPTYKIDKPQMAKREHGALIDLIVKNLNLKELFLQQPKYNAFSDVLKHGPDIYKAFDDVFTLSSEQRDDCNQPTLINISHVAGLMRIPHGKCTASQADVVELRHISSAQSDFEECKTALNDCKLKLKTDREVKAEYASQEEDIIEKHKEKCNNENFKTLKAASSKHSGVFGNLRHTVMNYIVDNASVKAMARVQWNPKEKSPVSENKPNPLVEGSSQSGTGNHEKADFDVVPHHERTWFMENFDRQFDELFFYKDYAGTGGNNCIDFSRMQHALNTGLFTKDGLDTNHPPAKVEGVFFYVGPSFVYDKFKKTQFKNLSKTEKLRKLGVDGMVHKMVCDDRNDKQDTAFAQTLEPDIIDEKKGVPRVEYKGTVRNAQRPKSAAVNHGGRREEHGQHTTRPASGRRGRRSGRATPAVSRPGSARHTSAPRHRPQSAPAHRH